MKKTYHQPDWSRSPYKAWLKEWSYKGTHVHQERKLSIRDKKYIRGRRKKPNLPSTWNDIYPSRMYATCWKDKTKKRKQWEK